MTSEFMFAVILRRLSKSFLRKDFSRLFPLFSLLNEIFIERSIEQNKDSIFPFYHVFEFGRNMFFVKLGGLANSRVDFIEEKVRVVITALF